MEANNFIAKLRASDANSDVCDLKEAFDAFKVILVKLPEKDKPSFALNVLCTLCRNLEKVPTWSGSINNTDLTTLSIECVRHTRNMKQADLVKMLACVFHIHKYVVKQSSKIPPELVLKLSFMPFESDEKTLLSDYYKTYWSILADRLTYIEKLKSMKLPIVKLLPKFIEDVIKVIRIYNTVQFCANLLTFLVKKLQYVYNDVKINGYLEKIFECIAKKDLKPFKELSEKEITDIYVKFNDCLYIISENGLKNNDSVIDNVSRICLSILGHRPDMFHCLQTLYPNAFCCVFKDKTNINLIENVLNSLLTSCEMTEKLGYKQTMNATYPFISQLLRLYIDNFVSKDIDMIFTEAIQEKCLKLILFLIPKLRYTNQMLKCENCVIKSGLHDALRLTFLVKKFITTSTNDSIELKNNLPLYLQLINQQYTILNELNSLGCGNYKKCLNKLQTDTHNTAILLNKSKYYEFSIQLFETYLKNEFRSDKVDKKNMSRALYNRSICELDFKLYEESLKNAYLSLIFALPDSLQSEKYMSLVMDIKAKAAKEETDVQMLSVLEASKIVLSENLYGDFGGVIKNLEFSILLKHEFSMYIKLWPSISPVAGVWKSLHELVNHNETWVKKEDPDHLLWSLYDVMMATPSAVRTIHDDTYRRIVYSILEILDDTPVKSSKEKLVYAALLCLKSEYELTDASVKYDWKKSESDPEAPCTRSIQHETEIIKHARTAVRELEGVTGGSLGDVLKPCLQIISVLVVELLHLSDNVHALQLAAVCCDLAMTIGDRETYLRNAGLLIQNSEGRTDLQHFIYTAAKYCNEMIEEQQCIDMALNFMCEVAIYYKNRGNVSISSKLLQMVQVKMLTVYEKYADINLDLSLGRLMEAQALLCSDLESDCPSMLSALNTVHRHYLSMTSNESRWCVRRLISLCIKLRASSCGAQCVRVGRVLRTLRRARASAAASGRTGAARKARMLADVIMIGGGDVQIKIDNSLKYILGLQPAVVETTNEILQKQYFTPKRVNLEAMRDCMMKTNQLSPSLCLTIPGFQIPEFLTHACSCKCHACELPVCMIIACQICALEASVYYRAKEMEIARNYFNGALDTFELAEVKLRKTFEGYKKDFRDFVIDIERKKLEEDFRHVQLEFLIELSYFELAQGDFETSDEYVVRIHEIMTDLKVDPYLRNEVYNLMVASAELRNVKKRTETGLEMEFENLKLSPERELELQKTPEAKTAVPKIETKIVKGEEIPKKRKVIKLNLDEANEDEKVDEKLTRSKAKKPQFKIPVPVTIKPVLENMTPRPTRSRPEIVITSQQSSFDSENIFTPKSSNEFFTPSQSPGEQFFTPQTSMKTYSKRIIKNLEKEFSTPKGKENHEILKKNVEIGSVKTLRSKAIKRATSPGKLEAEKTERSRRIRKTELD